MPALLSGLIGIWMATRPASCTVHAPSGLRGHIVAVDEDFPRSRAVARAAAERLCRSAARIVFHEKRLWSKVATASLQFLFDSAMESPAPW
jgi:hypothetical protein